jgi:hypothetical protein
MASKKWKAVGSWMARVFNALEFRSPTEPVAYGNTWYLVWKKGPSSYELTEPVWGSDPRIPAGHKAIGTATSLDEMTALYAEKVLNLSK